MHLRLSKIASLLADPTRAVFLTKLMDPRPLTAGELALRANVSPQVASAHLAKLVNGGLLQVDRRGRNRYYALSGPHVAEFLEALTRVCKFPEPSDAEGAQQIAPLRFARTCYDHLAGKLAVEVAERFVATRLLNFAHDEFTLTARGEEFFSTLGIDVPEVRMLRRAFARSCVDWSERRPHLAGALGAALLKRLESLKWIARMRGTRAVRLTVAGRAAFSERIGIRV